MNKTPRHLLEISLKLLGGTRKFGTFFSLAELLFPIGWYIYGLKTKILIVDGPQNRSILICLQQRPLEFCRGNGEILLQHSNKYFLFTNLISSREHHALSQRCSYFFILILLQCVQQIVSKKILNMLFLQYIFTLPPRKNMADTDNRSSEDRLRNPKSSVEVHTAVRPLPIHFC